MSKILLQPMVEAIEESSLPSAWTGLDLETFSHAKTLRDYQQAALRNARNALWKYYEAFVDYQRGEPLALNEQRKAQLWQWYRANGVDEKAMRLEAGNINRRFLELLHERYDLKDGTYEPFINRMSFWMATGSGKTLVIVKLIELLWTLIQRSELPPNDILFLTHRDDLIEQLRRHVGEFNAAHTEFRINLRDLREYDEVKRLRPSLFSDSEATVFYYRADNLSDEQKEKIVDFRNYENEGRWYVLLDEAHKGDRAESKRQHIYSMLSRNGFLFNFSATFTDLRDIATTVYNFNLSEYLWWVFSKIDESLDEVYLWYYAPNTGRMARFKPDFIFWLQKSNRYWILFVDPKGLAHTDWTHKVDSYRSLFAQDGRPRAWQYNGLTVQALLWLYTKDASKAPAEYRPYCVDTIEGLLVL